MTFLKSMFFSILDGVNAVEVGSWACEYLKQKERIRRKGKENLCPEFFYACPPLFVCLVLLI
jgi:hypothetical protein